MTYTQQSPNCFSFHKGAYEVRAHKQDDVWFTLFLYNNGEDVWDGKCYKSERNVKRAAEKYFAARAA